MSMLRLRGRFVALGLMGVLFAGCSDDKNPASPIEIVRQDMADDVALQTVASLSVTAADLQAAMASVPQATNASVRVAAPVRAMWDTIYTQGGLTVVASRDFYDASGNVLPAYGPNAVKMTWTSQVYGTAMFPRDTASVDHHGRVDVTGITPAQDTLRCDGTVSDSLVNRFRSYDGNHTRYGLWKSLLTIEQVRFLKSMIAAGLAYPIAGRCDLIVLLDRLRSNDVTDVEFHDVADVVVTFNGTALADVIVHGSYRYKWNLVNGQITRA